MKISILTTFPEMFSPLQSSILGRAQENGIIRLEVVNIRDFATNKHKNTDDYPFGGGAGMLMMAQPIFDAMEAVCASSAKPHRVFLSPKGSVFNTAKAQELSQMEHLVFLCGHYEGVDQRVLDNIIDEEISIGDYILTGGELPTMVVIDALSRFVPGVLGGADSAHNDSFSDGLLEYPQYTRPADFRGLKVPEVLLGGNHAQINKWRRRQQLKATLLRRPDLLLKAQLSQEDLEYLELLKQGKEPSDI